jgi:hypothetical protein
MASSYGAGNVGSRGALEGLQQGYIHRERPRPVVPG